MDSMTQIILGGAVAEVGFRSKLGSKAVAFGAFCGLLPDLDIIIHFVDRWSYIIHHRAFSHSIFVLLALTPILGKLGHLWDRKQKSYASWCHLTFWALITHPLLDVCTSYGTQLFWPYSNVRLSIDAIAIIDLFYTIPLLMTIVIGSMSYFSLSFRRYFACCMFLITTLYLALGYTNSQKAKNLVLEYVGNPEKIQTIRALPTPLNIYVWRVVVMYNDGRCQTTAISTWVHNPKITLYDVPNQRQHPLAQKALSNERGKIFQWFADDLITTTVVTDSLGTRVFIYDQRYGSLANPAKNIFAIQAIFNQDELRTIDFVRLYERESLKKEWDITWKIWFGNK